MGEYSIPFGVDFSTELCDVFEEQLVLGPAFRAIGFSPDNCPLPEASFE